MDRKLKIVSKTFSFVIIIGVLLILFLVFPVFGGKYSLIGFSIGTMLGEVLNKFWAEPLYIDTITVENDTVIIGHTNPFLKKGIKIYEVAEISNFKNVKKNIFRKNSRLEFDYKKAKMDFAYLKSEKELINKFLNNFI
ncbi:hypothetical protein ACFFVF_19815 [Flavobacterium jumunjinense]|uniref:PH domain-containing protein n=1 Tax=Flavobacterium jumunjinense TaxID=998845 RepID=A0ABV5GTP6_9FLAO|nr:MULTISPECIES: hypothetical protein [Flavobacterium]